MKESTDLLDLALIFPEAKLTMRDRLPIGFIYTNALITIQKSILNIQISSEEIKESIMGFVAMIPDSLKDEKFSEEIDASKRMVYTDVRPVFCGVSASPEHCKRKGIPMIQTTETFDYFKVLHSCFNLLMRKNMLLKYQPKEIFTGKRARKEAEEIEPSETDEL